ncbi:MAG: hypothetical protein HKN77_05175 [Woeseiaceae bacterium]|nr:hypothetical protein [Woeseiaceae bacterium]
MPSPELSFSLRLIRLYYAGTLVFLALDYFAGLNLRIAFLDGAGAYRAAYYLVCFACLALILWRPEWTVIVSAFESVVTLAALIISFGTRAIVVSDAMLEGVDQGVTMPEIVNFLMSGSVAYLAWARGMRELQQRVQ